MKPVLESEASCPRCLRRRSDEILINFLNMPLDEYDSLLFNHLDEAVKNFKRSKNEEGFHHVALKLYAYAHYATIRDFLEIPVKIEYEVDRFDLLVEGLSFIPQESLIIGVECITRGCYLEKPEIITNKINSAHYYLRMGEITHYVLYFDPLLMGELSFLDIISKNKL